MINITLETIEEEERHELELKYQKKDNNWKVMESFANMLEKELKLVCTTFEVGKGESFFI